MRGAFTARRGRSARVATIAGLALLAVPGSALADTKVSLENGPIGNGVSGDYVWVTDPVSIGDKPMEVVVTRSGSKVKVTDAAGDVRAGAGCERSGAAVLCPAAGLEGLRIEGGDNNDVLTNDTDLPSAMFGDGGKDDLQGGSNKDRMSGQEGVDHLRGGDARDTFSLEPGTDAIVGEGGRDVVTYGSASVPVRVNLDDALFNDGPVSEPDRVLDVEDLIGSPQADTLRGSDAANAIDGGAGDDDIFGEDGDDLLDGQAGGDDIIGGAGFDTVSYEDRITPVTVTLNGITGDGGQPDGAEDNVRDDVERVEGGSAGDELSGHPTKAIDNVLDGNGGADKLDGGAGDDQAYAGSGNDTIIGDPGTDVYDGSTGNDHLDYSNRSGDFTEDLSVTLGNSNPIALFGDDGGPSDGPEGHRDAERAIEKVTTGDGDDHLLGSDGPDTLVGGNGTDEFSAGLGADTLITKDDGVDTPISCGEGPLEPTTLDKLVADVEDVLANPDVNDPGNAAECENVTAT